MLLRENRSRRNFSRLGILVAASFLAAGAQAADSVHWFTSVEEASAVAVPANRPIMIDFWADWCGPCKVMEKEVYSSDDFQQATKRFIPVKIDFDKKTALARKYNVEALPTIVFADSYGNELFRYHGYVGAKPLLAIVNALPGDVTDFNRLNKILAGDKNNFEALEGMGGKMRAAGLYRASSEYYDKAVQRPQAKSNPEKREAILNEIGLNFLEVEDGNLAAQSFEKCLKEFPGSKRTNDWTIELGQSYVMAEKNDKARKLMDAFLRKNPEAAQSQKVKVLMASLASSGSGSRPRKAEDCCPPPAKKGASQ